MTDSTKDNLDQSGLRFLTNTDLWTPPAPSIATRIPSLKSRGSGRALLHYPQHNRQIVCESVLEMKVALVLMARDDVKLIEDQPAAVTYVDANGKKKRHTFDFRVTSQTYSAARVRTAIAVKPAVKAEKYGWAEIIKDIGRQTGPSFADRYVLLTEKNVLPDTVYNAQLILAARRVANDDHDQSLRDIAVGLHGAVTLADLIAASGLEADGMFAAARLIARGELIIKPRERICQTTLVRAPSTKKVA